MDKLVAVLNCKTFSSLHSKWELVFSLTKRELLSRYKGTLLGFGWAFANPILMLLVYTFVFGKIYGARWQLESTQLQTPSFSLILFAGLIVFNFFSESISRAPFLIVNAPNFVKKIIFPLEYLPLVQCLTALIHLVIGFLIWILFYLILNLQHPPVTLILLPVLLIPLFITVYSVSLVLSALGVYFRDIGSIIGFLVNILLFLSPIFYPKSALPQGYQWVATANPLAFYIEQARSLLIWNHGLDWELWITHSTISLIVFWIAQRYFHTVKGGFADVV